MSYPYLTSLFMNQGSGSIRQTSILYTQTHILRHLDIINNNEYTVDNKKKFMFRLCTTTVVQTVLR